jgi:hypothetical protein
MPQLTDASRGCALSVAFAIVAGATCTGGEELKPALLARTEFLTLDGSRNDAIEPDEAFALRVAISTPHSADPPSGLQLMGWLRRMDDSDLPCNEAAESFLRTGRLPLGAVFLNDPVIGVATTDGAFVVSDPDFSLASANIVGAVRVESRPAALVVDQAARRFLLALPDEDRVIGVDPTGQQSLQITDLDDPRQVVAAPQGGVAIRQADGRLILVADTGGRVELSTGVGALRPTANPRWLAATTADSALLFDLAARKLRNRVSTLGLLDAAALLDESGAPFALATLAGDEVSVHYLDAPGAPAMRTVLPPPATRLAAAPGGRVLLAWSPAARDRRRAGPAGTLG